MVDRPKSTALKHPKAWLSRRQGKTQALQRVQGKVKSFNPGAGCHDGGSMGQLLSGIASPQSTPNCPQCCNVAS